MNVQARCADHPVRAEVRDQILGLPCGALIEPGDRIVGGATGTVNRNGSFTHAGAGNTRDPLGVIYLCDGCSQNFDDVLP